MIISKMNGKRKYINDMKPTFVHCLFEQSGTFKNAFRQLNIPAKDYDIDNQFGQTDWVGDLFFQIENAYAGKVSIFDDMRESHLIMAFFPCIYFNEHNEMYFCGTSYNLRSLSPDKKLRAIIERSELRQEYYKKVLQLITVCEERLLKLVIENPYNAHHYWRFNFPYKPAVIDMNRTLRGDYFKKPTQYIFVNLPAGNGHSLAKIRPMQFVEDKKSSPIGGKCSIERSMISPEYAHNFICDFILNIPSGNNVPTLFDNY